MKYLLMTITMLLTIGTVSSQNPQRDNIGQKIEAQKIAFFTRTLDLTPEESQRFWPIYNEYSAKQKQLRDDFKANKPNRNMSEEEASEVINMFFENEQKKLNLRMNYYKKFQMILPSTKVVKLHFAERKFKEKLLEKLKKRKNIRKMRE